MSFDQKLRIELRNENGVLLSYINNLVQSVSWSWDRIGGCGDCSLRVKTDYDGALAGSFMEDAEIRIYIPNVAGTAELWYSGFIDKITPNISSDEYVDLYCLGYVNQLKRIIVREKTYAGKEISEIVRDIAEVYATAYTSVVSTAPNYEITDFTCDTIYFNESAFEAITKLADIAGKREWGVDANKNLFFKRRDDSIKNYFNLTQDFASFQPVKDFNPIVTKIFLEGSDGYKQTFEVTNKISVREKIISNSSISTESVAYQYARGYLKEKGKKSRAYTAKQIGRQTRVESTVPIGRSTIFSKIGIRSQYDIGVNDILSGGTASGDTEYSGSYLAAYACDNNTGTYWASTDSAFPHWWKYNLSSTPKIIQKVNVMSPSGTLRNFKVQGSNDDSTWIDLYTGLQPNDENYNLHTFANMTKYKYYRIYMTDNYRVDSISGIIEIELYEKANRYDSGLKYDGGNLTLQIEKIKYQLTDSGVNATLYLGGIPPSISDELAKLEYMINTERATI